jgi:hypothetical protein
MSDVTCQDRDMNTSAHTGHPFSVRKVKSGYTGRETYIVVKNPGAQRVTVHAHHSEDNAWRAANALNISQMVPLAEVDPRPYAERRAEAEAAFLAAGNRLNARPV